MHKLIGITYQYLDILYLYLIHVLLNVSFLYFSSIVDGSFNDLISSEVMSKSIVVTTTMTSRSLWLNGIEKGFFTYIFIDEAAQVNRI